MNKIPTFRIRETQEYSADTWDTLSSSNVSFEDVYNSLSDNYSDLGSIAKLEENQFQINFVGILIVPSKSGKDSYVFLCYPKYFMQLPIKITEDQRQIKQIIRVIKKTFESAQNYEDYYRADENNDLLALKIWLLKDYIDNGIYATHKTTFELNGKNDIVWSKTIDSVIPHITQKRKPLYLNFWTKVKERDFDNIVRRIHSVVLSEIIEEFTENSLLGILAPNASIDCGENRKVIGSDSKLSKLLQKELGLQYNTQKRKLLEKLKAYIDKSETSKNKGIQKYGVSKFNITWELVCKKLFADCLDDVMCNEGDHSTDCKYFNKTYREVIGKPKWSTNVVADINPDNIDETEEEDNVAKEIKVIEKDKPTLIPDIVLRKGDELVVLDAKYYTPEWPSNESEALKGVPGIGDITKQYLYQLIYADFAQSHNLKNRKNAFIMPVQLDDKEYKKRGNSSFEYQRIRHRGKVSLDLLRDLNACNKLCDIHCNKLSDIQVFEMDAETAFDAYLREGVGSRVDELIEVFAKGFQKN